MQINKCDVHSIVCHLKGIFDMRHKNTECFVHIWSVQLPQTSNFFKVLVFNFISVSFKIKQCLHEAKYPICNI